MAERFAGFDFGPSEADLEKMVRERERSPESQGSLKAAEPQSWREIWAQKMRAMGVPEHVAQGVMGGGERNAGFGLMDFAGPLPAAADAISEWGRGNKLAAAGAALGVVPLGKGGKVVDKYAQKTAAKHSFPAFHGTNVPWYSYPLEGKAKTGEGNHDFGWGHYVTESEALGEKYAKDITAQKGVGEPKVHVQNINHGRSTFMHWYKPFEEQPTVVREGLQSLFEQNGLDPAKLKGFTGEQIYDTVTKLKGSQEEASKVLSNFGVPGIKYPDSHTKKGKSDTSNYVIFSPQNKVTGYGTKDPGGEYKWEPSGIKPYGFDEAPEGVSTPGASTQPSGKPVAGAGKSVHDKTPGPWPEDLKKKDDGLGYAWDEPKDLENWSPDDLDPDFVPAGKTAKQEPKPAAAPQGDTKEGFDFIMKNAKPATWGAYEQHLKSLYNDKIITKDEHTALWEKGYDHNWPAKAVPANDQFNKIVQSQGITDSTKYQETIYKMLQKGEIAGKEYEKLYKAGYNHDWPPKAPLPPKGMKPVVQPGEDEVLMNTAQQLGGGTPGEFINKALDAYDEDSISKETLKKLIKIAKAQEDEHSPWDIKAAFSGQKAQTFAPEPPKNKEMLVEGVDFTPDWQKQPAQVAQEILKAAGGDPKVAHEILSMAPGVETVSNLGISSYGYKEHLLDIEKALRKEIPQEKPSFPDPSLTFQDLDRMAPEERMKYKDDLFPESDLPQDAESRAAREKDWREKGPDLDLYTGIGTRDASRRDAVGFKDPSGKRREPGIFLTKHPEIAEAYAEPNSKQGGHTMKLRLRAENPREVEWSDAAGNLSYDGDTMERLIRETWGMGHDALRVKNMRDIGWSGDQDQWIVKNPNQLRSTFAHFDPKHKKSRNLLRAAPPTMIGAGAIMAAKREKDKEDE